MSPTSDQEVEPLLQRGMSHGMQPAEARRWREMLDSGAPDTCGCVAAARAATVAGLLSLPLVAWSRRRGRALARSAAMTVALAALASVTGRRRAFHLRGQLLAALRERVVQLEQHGKEAPTERQA
jgi:hypothetical protein